MPSWRAGEKDHLGKISSGEDALLQQVLKVKEAKSQTCQTGFHFNKIYNTSEIAHVKNRGSNKLKITVRKRLLPALQTPRKGD